MKRIKLDNFIKDSTHELNSIIDEQLEYLSLLALKRGITIEVSSSNSIYFAILEDDFIRLFNNLITNAIKYNRQNGRIEITIKDNKITIKDTGIGIAKDNQKEIYQRFYRASSEVGGFGIGLNIVNKICKKYGIKIDIESQLGDGSSFRLEF